MKIEEFENQINQKLTHNGNLSGVIRSVKYTIKLNAKTCCCPTSGTNRLPPADDNDKNDMETNPHLSIGITNV